MKLNLDIKTKRDRDNLANQLASMSFEKRLSDDLTVMHYRNGDEIVEAKTPKQFAELGLKEVPAFIINKNGKYFYNWYAVNDDRGLAPEGFHIPSDEEWDELKDQLSENPTHNGYVSFNDFYNTGNVGNWWSSSASGASSAWYRYLNSNNPVVYRNNSSRQNGFSVRCVKDN